ncbi:MAG: hypothetical protein M1816_006077 [Peltula sp. TS41687]|nr:MAG: hypothetical protein M1816_006077 [Peltula sp. TS41687]
MVWKGLNDGVFAGWLTSIVCCVSSDKPQHEEVEGDDHLDGGGERHHEVSEKTMEICYDQPSLITPPRPGPRHHRSESRSSILASQWKARSRSLVLEASQSGRVMVRRMTGEPPRRRPTISGPSSFRHLGADEQRQGRRHADFRPLELSIYLPHNRLSPLPDFSSPDHGSVLAPRTFSVRSDSSSAFRIARKPLKPSVDLSLCDLSEYRIMDTRSIPSVLGFEASMQPLRSRPSLPASLNTSHERTSLSSKQLPKPPSTLRACSYTGPICQMSRRDSDPFVSSLEQLKRERALSGETLSGNTEPNMSGIDAVGPGKIKDVYAPPRPQSPSPRTSIMARPHPLKPLAPLPLTSIPFTYPSIYRPSSTAPAMSRPTNQQHELEPSAQPTSLATDTSPHRPSTASTMYTGSTGPSTPPTSSPQSSPSRPAPIRQRTFGFIEAKSHFEPINEVHVNHDQAWMVDGTPAAAAAAAAAADATTRDILLDRFAGPVGIAV